MIANVYTSRIFYRTISKYSRLYNPLQNSKFIWRACTVTFPNTICWIFTPCLKKLVTLKKIFCNDFNTEKYPKNTSNIIYLKSVLKVTIEMGKQLRFLEEINPLLFESEWQECYGGNSWPNWSRKATVKIFSNEQEYNEFMQVKLSEWKISFIHKSCLSI